MINAYTIKRNKLTGKASVHFPCDKCRVEIICPLSDAGTKQACPDCGTRLDVPGQAEWAADKAERAKAEALEREDRARIQRDAIRAKAELTLAAASVKSDRRNRTARTWSLSLTGIVMMLLGLAGVIAAVFYSTTTYTGAGTVHNIGLLNDRLCLVAFGAPLLAGGLLCLALARVGEELNRGWNEITNAIRERDNAAD